MSEVNFRKELAYEILKDCPPEAMEDHNTIVRAILKGESIDEVLKLPELASWPETYAFLRDQFRG